jgi:hypothetical protein
MAAQVGAPNKPRVRRPPRALPAAASAAAAAAEDDAIIEISEDDPEEAPPEREPLFSIGDEVYTMLKDPPLTLAMQARNVGYERGEGYAEIFLMREMLGEDAYRALLANRSLKGPQLQAITARVSKRLFGVLERETASPNR